jgi:type I restriction enzyme S subunit
MNQIKQGYKQTKVGIIPKDWDVVKIKEATSYVDYRGKTPIKTGKGIFLVTAKNIKQGFIDYEASSEFVSEVEYHEIMKRGMPKIGDILITTEAPLGNVAQIDKENIALAQRVIKFRSKKNVKNDFLKHYFLSNRFQSYLYRMAIGTTVLGIQGKELHNMSIVLPPIKEQEKIAEILTTWDEAITKQTELLRAKELLKIALMQKLLSGEVRFSGFSDDWDEVRLGEICKITTGKLNANAMVENGKYTFFTCARETYKINEFAFDTEALLVSGNGANVGYIHYFKGKFNAYQRTYVLDDFEHDIFLIKYLLDKYLSLQISREKNEGNTPYITLPTLTKMKLKLPSLPEQQKIAEVLSLADDEINLLKNELEELKLQKKALMQKLLTGEVRVKV